MLADLDYSDFQGGSLGITMDLFNRATQRKLTYKVAKGMVYCELAKKKKKVVKLRLHTELSLDPAARQL
jgi:hypothetical protein